jgi:hypothetical protein
MDREGIDIAVPFPTLGLYTVDARDPELNAGICRAYNNWLHEEYLAADRRRLIGIGMVTLLDVGAAVEELRRLVSTLGFKGVYLRPNPVGGRALHDPAFGLACRSCSMKAPTDSSQQPGWTAMTISS